MTLQSPVYWHEGLFLQQHHLQLLQRQTQEQFIRERQLAWPYAYGLVESRLSEDALAGKVVRFDRLRAVMPSGLEVVAGGNCELAQLNIADVFRDSSDPLTIWLSVPLYYEDRPNSTEADGPDKGTLYRTGMVDVSDENTGSSAQPVRVRRINARLVVGPQVPGDVELLPLARIYRATDRTESVPRRDARFIPPCLVLGGCDDLVTFLRDLVKQVEAVRSEVSAQLSRSDFNFDKLTGAQHEQLLRLRSLNVACGRLSQLLLAQEVSAKPGSARACPFHGVSPFTFYLELRDLLGGLAALRPEADHYATADYKHEDLWNTFDSTSERIRRILRPPEAFEFDKVALNPEGKVLTGKLLPEQWQRASAFYLGVRFDGDAGQLARFIEDPDQCRLKPRSMVGTDIQGVRLVEHRDPIPGLPPRDAGLYFFRLEHRDGLSGQIWEMVKKEGAIAIESPRGDVSQYQVVLYMPIGRAGK